MNLDTMVALSVLSEGQREAFIDRTILGRPYPAIAADMGHAETTVRRLERRAAAVLRLMLDEERPS